MSKCNHQWVEVQRWPVEPIREISMKGASQETMNRFLDAMQGSTTIELKCSECGDVTSRSLPGFQDGGL